VLSGRPQTSGQVQISDAAASSPWDTDAVSARLAVAGGRGASVLRATSAHRSDVEDYDQGRDQSRTSLPTVSDGTAYERSPQSGPLEVLPCMMAATVDWTCNPGRGRGVLSFDDRHLSARDAGTIRLQRRGDCRQDPCLLPMKLTRAATTVAARMAIGQRGASLHPSTGKVFNLGLRGTAMRGGGCGCASDVAHRNDAQIASGVMKATAAGW